MNLTKEELEFIINGLKGIQVPALHPDSEMIIRLSKSSVEKLSKMLDELPKE